MVLVVHYRTQKTHAHTKVMTLASTSSLSCVAMVLLLLPFASFRGAKCGTVAGLRQRRDILLNRAEALVDGSSRTLRAVVIPELSKWPGAILPYTISDNLGESAKEAVAEAIDAFTKQSCIQFKRRTNERDYVTFQSESSCSSRIGRIGLQQFISISPSCEIAGKVMHEIYHALGRWHEHARPDRDLYIKINTENIIASSLSEFRTADSTYATVQGLPYDYDSIMHYEATAFSVNAQPTIQPLNLSISLDRLGQREKLSPLDLQHLAILYCNGWGQWTPWEECSAQCGGGTRRRSRPCLSKDLCRKDENQEEPCNIDPCPVWSDWSGWSPCNKSCGSGFQSRTRVCINSTRCTGESTQAVPCHGTMCMSSSVPAMATSLVPIFATPVLFTSVLPVITPSVTVPRAAIPSAILTGVSINALSDVQSVHKTTSMKVASTSVSAAVTLLVSQSAVGQHLTPTPVMEAPHIADDPLWSLCSRGCGGGVQFKVMVAQGRVERNPCNTQPCNPMECQQEAQLCTTEQCLIGLRKQKCYTRGKADDMINRTLIITLNLTSPEDPFLLQCTILALSAGYRNFGIIADQCYLSNGSFFDVAFNCSEPSTLSETPTNCCYEVTDAVLLRHSVQNLTTCQANFCQGKNACSGAPAHRNHQMLTVMAAILFLLRGLL